MAPGRRLSGDRLPDLRARGGKDENRAHNRLILRQTLVDDDGPAVAKLPRPARFVWARRFFFLPLRPNSIHPATFRQVNTLCISISYCQGQPRALSFDPAGLSPSPRPRYETKKHISAARKPAGF
jgi:hypothetical protein